MKKLWFVLLLNMFGLTALNANCVTNFDGKGWVYHEGKNCARDFHTNMQDLCRNVATAPSGGTPAEDAEIRTIDGRQILYAQFNGSWIPIAEVSSAYELPEDLNKIQYLENYED